MANNRLKIKLQEMWNNDATIEWEPVREDSDGTLHMRLSSTHSNPKLNTMRLMSLCDLFGTRDIEVDNYARIGCETCGYGGESGHDIEVRKPKKRVKEFRAWLIENKKK